LAQVCGQLPGAMADHLVVLQHGICGTSNDLSNIAQALDIAFPGRLRMLLSRVCEGRTLDGVAAGGTRLAQEVRSEAPRRGGCISFVCHSLGGLYARHALRLLEAEDWFAHSGIRAVNFVTTASPHLGIMEVGVFWRWGIWLLHAALGSTIRDLSLHSDTICSLTDEVAIRSLQRFERRAVYGNFDDDMWVRPCSALLMPCPPSSDGLNAGVPEAISEVPSGDEFVAFPDEHRTIISEMTGRLCKLEWERYVVHFPSRHWTGAAHSKICNHAVEDTANWGVHVVFHICKSFLAP